MAAASAAPAPPAWDFCLPLSPADLLRRAGASQYVVQKVLPLQQLSGRLSEFQTTFRAQGALAVLHHFDTPYSILHHLRAVDSAIKEDALELMIKVVASHAGALTSVLNDADVVPSVLAHLNALKMNCYLLVRLVEAFETESGKSNLVGLDARRKSKKRQTIGFVWEEERQTVLQVLTQLLQLDLHRLWNGLAVEEEFVSLVTSCSYRILQNPSIGHQKYRPTREAAIHLLGIALQRYDHMLSATLKVTQMLQHFEHAPPVFIEAVSVWIKEYGMKSIVGELLREIGQKCPNDLARDASGMKGYAAFLAELAEQTPAVVLANMSVLMHHLDGENYGMRNAILTAMAEVLLQVLNGEQLEESARSTRDQFLDTLQAHTCDVHGFVRSRVLQLFTRIVQQKALPLTRFQAVVTLAVGRLQDKSVTVVKNAIQLLAAFLSNNPFFCKLSCTELTDLLAKERQKLQEMKKCSTPAAVVISPEEEWEAMQPEIQATLKTCLSSQEQEEEPDQFKMEDSAQLSNSIVQLLRISNYKGAIRLTQEGMRHFQEVESFATPRGKGDDEDFILSTLRTFYLGSQTKNVVQESTEDTNQGGTEEQVPVIEEEQAAPEIVKQEMLVQYLQDAHNFSTKITEALSMVSKLMYECSVSVVQEAIEFFVVVSQFSIPQAILGVRQMLPLIWSKEPGIREAVLDAYRRLYLNPSGETERARAQNLVHSLSLLMVDASLATIKCLGEIISEFVQKDEIKSAVVQLLWERFTEKSQCSVLERHAAIMLLGMMASGNPEIVGSNLDVLVNVGLDERAHEDYHLAQEVCHAISKIGNSQKPSLGKNTAPFRLPQSHMLFDRLHEAVTVGFGRSSAYWIPFAETAVALIYQLAEGPEELCAQILQSCSQRALKKLQESERTEAEPGSSPKSAGDDSGTVNTVVLTHLVSLVGNVALQQLVHLELSVSNELRRRRILGEEQEAKEQAASKTKAQKGKSTGNETTMEEDLGLVGASAEDTEAELIRTICETELLDGKQLLSAFFPLVLNICNSPGLCNDPALAAAAALALGKYCMISAEFCDTHLRLFFTMMEKSTHSSVRANLMIAAGDLAIRFPNQVEPWTSHLYTRLRDPCPYVRQTAALVMTHLILKDMVKVKGQVSEMATLLIDPEEEIARLARNFFTELSSKDNAVYNLLPDIISRLSDPDSGIEELPFHTIMRQLFSFITKDKQTESLVEKLCQRFRTARTERQHHDLAYCLTLLPLTDRSIHKMQNNFDCFADKLQDTTVYNYFLAALGRFRRVGRKPEMKALTDEFEQKLRMCHSKGLDSFNDNPEDSISQEGKNTPVAQPAKKRATNSHRRPLRASNADSFTPTPRLSRSHRKASQRKMTVVFSSDEENNSEEELYAELREEETPLKTTPISRSSSRRVQ